VPSQYQAFADESFHETDTGRGFYVLAAAVFEPDTHDAARVAMIEVRGKHAGKLHWHKLKFQDRRNAVKRVADLGGLHVVVVGTPVSHTRQERARAMCLTKLTVELHGYGVTELVMESRSRQLNRRDLTTVAGARQLLPRGADFRAQHVPGAMEPLTWAADIIAGAVRAHQEGDPAYLDLLRDRVYEIQVPTGC
jgi:hypothetical protein